MSLRLPKIQTLGNAWDRIWDSLSGVHSPTMQGRKPRSLKIDPLEERQLLSISADATTLLVNSTSAQYTLGAQSVATDDNGDVVVCWTGYDTVFDSEKNLNITDANIYAKYLTQDVQQISLAQSTKSFSLIYGSAQTSDGKLAIVQKLAFSSTTASLENDASTLAGSIELNFGGQSITQSYRETGYKSFASNLQASLRALGGQFEYATVVAEDARTFNITFAAKTDSQTGMIVNSSGVAISQTYLTLDSQGSLFTSGYLPAVTMSTVSRPLVIGTIAVDATNPANTISAIESYLEGKTATTCTYLAPCGDASVTTVRNVTEVGGRTYDETVTYYDVLPALEPDIASLGLDVTVTYSKDSNGLYRYNIQFNGDGGKAIIPQLQLFSTASGFAKGSDVGTVKIIKQSSEAFRVNAAEPNNTYTYGLDLYDQKDAAVAMDGDGDFIITWEGENADGSYDVYARRFSPQSYDYTALLASDVTSSATAIVVTSTANLTVGCTIVIGSEQMTVKTIGTTTTSGLTTLTVERGVNKTVVTAHKKNDTVASKNLMQVEMYDVKGNSYTSAIECVQLAKAPITTGLALLANDPYTFRVNTNTANDQGDVSIGINSSGTFVISWGSKGQYSSFFNSVYYREFTADGKPVSTDKIAVAEDANEHSNSFVAVSHDGNIGVVWTSYYPTLQNGYYATTTTIDGVVVTSAGKTINLSRIGSGAEDASIAFDMADDFVIAWAQRPDNDSITTGGASNTVSSAEMGVYARLYNASGTIIQDTFRANSASLNSTSTTSWAGYQGNPQVVIDADGDITISYEGYGVDVSDTTSLAILPASYLAAAIASNPDLEEYLDNLTAAIPYSGGDVDGVIDSALFTAQSSMQWTVVGTLAGKLKYTTTGLGVKVPSGIDDTITATDTDDVILMVKSSTVMKDGTTLYVDSEKITLDGDPADITSVVKAFYTVPAGYTVYKCTITRGVDNTKAAEHDQGAIVKAQAAAVVGSLSGIWNVFSTASTTDQYLLIEMWQYDDLAANDTITIGGETMTVTSVTDYTDNVANALGSSYTIATGNVVYLVSVTRGDSPTTHAQGSAVTNDDFWYPAKLVGSVRTNTAAASIGKTSTLLYLDLTTAITAGQTIYIGDEAIVVNSVADFTEAYTSAGNTAETGHYYYMVDVTRDSTTAAVHAKDSDVKAQLTDAQIENKLGRLSAILNNYFGLLRGEANGVMFSQFDAQPTYGITNAIMTDTIVNQYRDGNTERSLIVLDRDITSGNFVLRIHDPYNSDVYQDVTVTPVIDYVGLDANGDPQWKIDSAETIKAINAAMETAVAELGISWPSNVSDGPIRVREITADEINLRAGTDWELTGVDSAPQIVFEVTYQGEVHDLQVTVELAPSGNHLLKEPIAEEQTITFSVPNNTANGGLYYALSLGGTTSADLTFSVTEYIAGTLDMSAQIKAALEAIAAQNAALAGLDPAPVVIVDVEMVDGSKGLQYTIKFHGLSIGVDQALIALGTTKATYTAPSSGTADSTIYTEHGGQLFAVEVVKGVWPKANDPLTPVETQASNGTWQQNVSVAIQSNGTLVFAWTQYNEYTGTTGDSYYGETIYVRTFEESTDTAGAVVTGIESADGTEVVAGGTMTVASITDGIAKIVLNFNEALYCVPDVETQLNILGVTKFDSSVGTQVTINGVTVTLAKASEQQIATAEAQWEKSALNPEAYQILSNGTALNGVIVGVQYGLNAAVDAGLAAVGSNKYQVVLTFDYNQAIAGYQPLPLGNYTVKVKHYVASTDSGAGQVGICDVRGNSLNLTGFTSGGADFIQNFTVATSSGAGTPTTPDAGATDTPTNTTETGTQDSAVVASAADGSYVVVWVRYGANGDTTSQGDIIAQRYDSTGNAVGGEFVVNTYTTGSQISPSVSMNDNGSFVVVWSGVGTGGYSGIWARQYSSKGVATTDQIRITQISTASQVTPSVAMDASGGFVVTWVKSASAQSHIYARYYNSYGTAVTNEFKVNTTNTANAKVDVSIAAGTGKYVIVWQSCSTKGTDLDIHARLYNAASNKAATGELTINTYMANMQIDPAVAMADNGSFVVTWSSYGQDGSGYGIYARRYNAAGAAVSGEFLVNRTTDSTQWQSEIACDSSGNFTIAWAAYGLDNALAKDYGIYARMYYADGTDYIDTTTGKALGEFRINATVIGDQITPNLARNASNSDYVVVWVGPDTDGTGVFTRRVDPPTKAGVKTSGAVSISTIGLYDAATATAYLRTLNSAGTANLAFNYGTAASKWTVISGDWDGDGVTTLGLYDPSTSTFYLVNSNSSGSATVVFKFGTAKCGYTPIAGDWDGNGTDTVGLYNSKTATFYLRNSNTTGSANLTFKFGTANAGYMPVIGDWDGNGTETVGVYNGKTSTFYLRNSNNAGSANMTFKFGTAKAGSIALAGDWNGDGKDTIGLYTAKTATFALRDSNSAGSATKSFVFGSKNTTWKPIVGDWNGYGLSLMGTEVKTANASTKSVSSSEVQTLVSEAISRWVSAGISSAQAALLASVKYVVTDLAGANLGLADGNVIYIDANAAGNGWYVDSTPRSDSEFASGSKVKGMDLLTVLEHEMGHILGLDDLNALANDVMARTLAAGTRHNASYEDTIDLILGSK